MPDIHDTMDPAQNSEIPIFLIIHIKTEYPDPCISDSAWNGSDERFKYPIPSVSAAK